MAVATDRTAGQRCRLTRGHPASSSASGRVHKEGKAGIGKTQKLTKEGNLIKQVNRLLAVAQHCWNF